MDHAEPTRADFMLHAYNMMFSGRIERLDTGLKQRVANEILTDLCAVVREFPREDREAFIALARELLEPN